MALDERDPLGQLLDSAPVDDEPISSDEDDALRQARQEARAGEVVPADVVRRELG